MNIKEIQEMIKLMQENDITEFQLERNGLKIVLKRGKAQVEVVSAISHVPAVHASAASPAAPSKEEVKEPSNLKEVVSPMVGTFYASPSPESAAYAQVGKQVNVGDVVCIIEAMKVMNEIKSEIAGVISEILVENGQPVEYGQPLFRVKPAA
jgi:acetyl-CoA carboxylase biotin carboxyl carrier protein